jgi:hypothetical protein
MVRFTVMGCAREPKPARVMCSPGDHPWPHKAASGLSMAAVRTSTPESPRPSGCSVKAAAASRRTKHERCGRYRKIGEKFPKR